MRILLLTLCFLAAGTLSSAAASSQWQTSEGAALRLVTAGPANGATLRGALEIALEPGWKTYWRDPGDTGIPPEIDASKTANIVSAAFSFPAPHRVDEGYGSWAGYAEPVTLPVTFTLDGPVTTLEANVFLGICKEICIPVQASFSLNISADVESSDDERATVQAAFASLPATPSLGFGVRAAEIDGEALSIEARVPDTGGKAQLFLASGEGYTVGVPEPKAEQAGTVSFSVRLLAVPENRTGSVPPLDYTLVSGGRAVSGTLADGSRATAE